ncbi:hypothetical protein PSTT_05806 [Puccinia striiformis]|uniref:Proteasome activator PA28 C-terminal domain-containing protein n=1 Tax=Puccinia striiformis TaxID=27350 RepID=A0A2S4VMT2_9BASI|nr:hypothetical protein PSTT_05806 [Puccinia striiformis]
MTTTNALWSETTDKGVQTQLKSWAQDIEQKGKEAIHAQLPAKILEINQILENFSDSTLGQLIVPSEPTTTSSPTDQPESNSGRKKRKVANGKEAQPSVTDQAVPGGVKNPTRKTIIFSYQQTLRHMINQHSFVRRSSIDVSSNPRVNAHYIFLRTHWEELIDITNAIKIHINLLVPKIEDGDTFGVQVQEECLSELSRAQDSGYNLLEAQLKHNMSRAKLASKLIKYPNVEDYQIALQEHDRKSIFLCRQHLLDLRNIYALLTDLLHKNIVKITKPKGANSDGM